MKQRIAPLSSTIARLTPEITALYQDLHANPELSMQEFRTADIVARYLTKLGYQVNEKIGITGVVGVLHNGKGKTVMLRADMDALPMAEKTGLPFASQKTGETLDGVKTPDSPYVWPRSARCVDAGRGFRTVGTS